MIVIGGILHHVPYRPIAYRENPLATNPATSTSTLCYQLLCIYIVCTGMSLRLTSAPVSGIKKRKSTTTRARSSPFAAHSRTKPRSNTNITLKDASTIEDEDFNLPDLGLSNYIPSITPATTVLEAIYHIRNTTFEDLPATRTGMNSTRIAEVLNFRRSLPPLVSVAHVHTLLDAPTRTEREIVELVTMGRVRRLIVPGRGNDAAGLGDCLVLKEEWEELVRNSSLEELLKGLSFSLFGSSLLTMCREIPHRPQSHRYVLRHRPRRFHTQRIPSTSPRWIPRLLILSSKRLLGRRIPSRAPLILHLHTRQSSRPTIPNLKSYHHPQ